MHFLTVLAIGLLLATLSPAAPPSGAGGPPPDGTRVNAESNKRGEPLVDITRACPGVVVELRYAGDRNLTGRPIYPPGSRALVRQGVAVRLNNAQESVRQKGFNLKVWDAYRPAWVQRVLWEAVKDPAYVVQPSETGSLHNWGVAVDVTLVDYRGEEAAMPTDFDAFTTAARYDYKGKDPQVAFNLKILKDAMAGAGFRHISDEWWHYSSSDSQTYGPIDFPLEGAEKKEPKEVKVFPEEVKKPEPMKTETPKVEEPKPEPPEPRRVVLFPPRDEPPPTPKTQPTPRPKHPAAKAPEPAKKKQPRVKRPLFPPRPGEVS